MKRWLAPLRRAPLALGLLLGLGVLTAVAVALYARTEREEVLQHWREQLRSAADDRRQGLERLLTRHLAAARIIASFPTAVYVCTGQQGPPYPFPRSAGAAAHLRELLASSARSNQQTGVWLIDRDGRPFASDGSSATLPGGARALAALAASTTDGLVEMHVEGTTRTLLFLAPIRKSVGDDACGTAVLTADPGTIIDPYLALTGLGARTAKAWLLRIDDHRVTFLSGGHFAPGAHSATFVRNGAELAAAAKGSGAASMIISTAGGTRALAAVRRLKRAPWTLAVTIDEAEALETYDRRVQTEMVMAGALALAISGLGFGVWRSERARWERSLARSEARFSVVLDQAHDPVLFVDTNGRIVDANRRAVAFYGYSREELIGLPANKLRTEAEQSVLGEMLERAAALEQHVFEVTHERRDGTSVPVEISASYVAQEKLFVKVIRDITERRAAETRIQALIRALRTRASVDELIVHEQDRDRLLRSVCERAVVEGEMHSAWIGRVSPDGRIVPEVTAGAPLDYLAGNTVRWDSGPLSLGPSGTAVRENATIAIADVATDERFAPWRESALRNGVHSCATSPLRVHRQVVGVISFHATEPHAFEGEVLRLIDSLAADLGHALEILEDRRRHEEESRRAEEVRRRLSAERDLLTERLALQFERMPVGCIVTDDQGNLVAWNPAAEQIFGHRSDDVLGLDPVTFLATPEAAKEVRTVVADVERGNNTVATLSENVTRDGRTIQCEWTNIPLKDDSGRLLGVMAMVQDVTDRLRLEDELRQAQKMEAIGRLAGGIAHDFNNLLTVVLGNAEEALADLAADDPRRRNIADVEQAAERAAALTRQLLAFSRRQMLRPETVDLNAVVTRMNSLLRRVIGEDVLIETDLVPEVGHVMADPGQVEQILLNLCINARDAMPDGGALTLITRNVEIGPAERRLDPAMAEGPHVCLTVRDTGTGMSEDVKAHIFEPFFTTKEIGKGTGLGLSTVYGIVRQSHGGIYFESAPGAGTAFSVCLPRVRPSAAVVETTAATTDSTATTGTILLAEDEPAVRALTARALTNVGYRVLEASSGQEAIAMAEKHAGRIDLLITDVVMPGMNGSDLAGRMRGVRPGIRILYTSGYSDTFALQTARRDDDASFLQKPFTLPQVRAAVRSLLEADQA